AETSQRRAAEAYAAHGSPEALVPIVDAEGEVLIAKDEIPRPQTTAEGLASLPPSFEQLAGTILPGFDESFADSCRRVYPDAPDLQHVHHAGNSSALADGASAMLLAAPDFARAHGLEPRARIRMTAVAGAEPVIMLTAPSPASQ